MWLPAVGDVDVEMGLAKGFGLVCVSLGCFVCVCDGELLDHPVEVLAVEVSDAEFLELVGSQPAHGVVTHGVLGVPERLCVQLFFNQVGDGFRWGWLN